MEEDFYLESSSARFVKHRRLRANNDFVNLNASSAVT